MTDASDSSIQPDGAAAAGTGIGHAPSIVPTMCRTRFTWAVDADLRLIASSPELAYAVGEQAALRTGELLPERLRDLGADPERRVAAAMVARNTWGKIELKWPCANGGALDVDLWGSPVWCAARRWCGFRGFGLIHVVAGPAAFLSVGAPVAGTQPTAAATGTLEETAAASTLSASEQSAFAELARNLKSHLKDADVGEPNAPAEPPPAEGRQTPGTTGTAVIDAQDQSVAAVLDRLPLGVLVARDGTVLYVNRTLLDLLGYDDLPAFDRAGGADAMPGCDASTDGREVRYGAVPILRSDGEMLLAEARLQTVVWRGAAAIQVLIQPSIEATAAGRMEVARSDWQALERENAELRAVLDTATDGVAILDHDGRILTLNRSGEALFGLDANDVAGEPMTVLLAPESRAAAFDSFAGLKGTGIASVMHDGREVIGRTGDGGHIPLFMSLGQLPGDAATRYCAVLRDLTPSKRIVRDLEDARRAAERADRLNIEFLTRVNHDIRTPLDAIIGLAEIMISELAGPLASERSRRHLHDIHATGVQVIDILNGQLDLAKVESGQIDLAFASVNANKTVADCVTQMRDEAERARVILRQALAPRLPNIVADEVSLRQMVLSLLSNAIKFNTVGGQVIVSTALTDAGAAVVRIRDTGTGMSEAEIRAALEPFSCATNPRRSSSLGLSLARALAEANRAALSVKSNQLGGTLVEVAFPATCSQSS